MMVSLIFILHLSIRSQYVYLEKRRVLHEVFYNPDGSPRKDWDERIKVYEKISYDEMVLKFWRPVSSFYKDTFPKEN